MIDTSKRSDLVRPDVLDRNAAVAATLGVAGAVALVHAALTWSPVAALRFGLIAAGLAFVAEVVVVNAGWLVHRLRPRVLGVPLPVLTGWIAAMYVACRAAALLVDPPWIPLVAATLATTADLAGDPVGVAAGLWEYPEDGVAGPQIAGIPWWNFAGWFLLTYAVAAVAVPG